MWPVFPEEAGIRYAESLLSTYKRRELIRDGLRA